MPDMMDPFNEGVSIFAIFFSIIVLVILGMIIYQLSEAMKNSNAKEERHLATLIDKLTSHSMSRHENHTSSSTTYTLTFELENGERKSLDVSRKDYLKYVVGDTGRLSFQRKRFNDFQI